MQNTQHPLLVAHTGGQSLAAMRWRADIETMVALMIDSLLEVSPPPIPGLDDEWRRYSSTLREHAEVRREELATHRPRLADSPPRMRSLP